MADSGTIRTISGDQTAVDQPRDERDVTVSAAEQKVQMDKDWEAGNENAANELDTAGDVTQGACLALEYSARNPERFGGVAGLSGGLIGENLDNEYPGNLHGTPVFLGCSDIDPHIPLERVNETEEKFNRLGGNVTKCIYPNMTHSINRDELDHISSLMLEVKK